MGRLLVLEDKLKVNHITSFKIKILDANKEQRVLALLSRAVGG